MLEGKPAAKRRMGEGGCEFTQDEDLTFPNSSSKESVALQVLLMSWSVMSKIALVKEK